MCADAPVTIRSYRPADQAGLIELIRELQGHEVQIYDRMKPPEDIGAWYVDELLRQCRDNAGGILVADNGERLAGYATILTAMRQDDHDETAYTYALVGDLAVTGDFRGKGLGRQLLEACEARAREAGTKWLRVSVLHRNGQAVSLYRKFGFRDHLLELEKPLS